MNNIKLKLVSKIKNILKNNKVHTSSYCTKYWAAIRNIEINYNLMERLSYRKTPKWLQQKIGKVKRVKGNAATLFKKKVNKSNYSIMEMEYKIIK